MFCKQTSGNTTLKIILNAFLLLTENSSGELFMRSREGYFWLLFPTFRSKEGNKHKNTTLGWTHYQFITKMTIFTHRLRVPLVKFTLQWRHNGHDSVSNHQPHDCLLNHLFRRRSKKTSKLCVRGICAGNSPGPVNSQMASNAENVSIWWRHHDSICLHQFCWWRCNGEKRYLTR